MNWSHHFRHTPKMVALLAAVSLSACQTTEPGVEVRLVPTPVPQPCLPADQIPAEPETVGHLLNGVAAHDLSIVAASALELRAVVQEMRAALIACAGSELGSD